MNKALVKQLINGVLIREGAGVKLHRYIGVDRTNDFEPILLLDYFNSDDPIDYMAGFPAHPHRGFEAITYLLEGQIRHQDNQGHEGTIDAGDVQWMTAGKGIIHSEMPSSSTGRLRGLQIWINLPAQQKMSPARYQELKDAQFPVEHTNQGAQIKVIAGVTDTGTSSPISPAATAPLFFDIHLLIDGLFTQFIPANYEALVFVLEGAAMIDEVRVEQGVMAKIDANGLLEITAEKESHCLLLAAKKLHEPIARHGPFVMNTHQEVMQALDDFRNGLF